MLHVLLKPFPYIGLCCSQDFKLYIETGLEKNTILVAFLFFTSAPYFGQTSPFLGTIVWLAVRSPQVSPSRLEVKAAPWREYWWPSRRTHARCHHHEDLRHHRHRCPCHLYQRGRQKLPKTITATRFSLTNSDLPPLSMIISKTPPSKQYLNKNDHQVTDKRDASAEAFHEPLSPLGPYPPVPRYPRCQHVPLLRANTVFWDMINNFFLRWK